MIKEFKLIKEQQMTKIPKLSLQESNILNPDRRATGQLFRIKAAAKKYNKSTIQGTETSNGE